MIPQRDPPADLLLLSGGGPGRRGPGHHRGADQSHPERKNSKPPCGRGIWGYVLGEVFQQEEAGAHILDVNVGLPGLDEPAVLTQTVEAIQEVTGCPCSWTPPTHRHGGRPAAVQWQTPL